MRVLLASTRGAGHVGPLLPFADALARAGDDVIVAVPRAAVPLVERAGLAAWPLASPATREREVLASLPPDDPDERARLYAQELFVRLYAGSALPGMLAAVAAWRPDLVLHETHELASPLAAERHGIPSILVGIMRWAGDAWIAPLVAPAVDELRLRCGLAPDPTGSRLFAAPLVTLTPPALEQPGALPPQAWRFRERARLAPGALPWWPPGDARPLVYLTFGTEIPRLPGFDALLASALSALADLPVRVLATVGDGIDPWSLRGISMPNAHVEQWVPQRDVLPHAALVVCHAGFGTLRGALSAGVPLVTAPRFADQPANARRVVELGAGLELGDDLDGLAGAVARVLAEPAFRAAAHEVAAEVGALPSVDESPALLRRLAASVSVPTLTDDAVAGNELVRGFDVG